MGVLIALTATLVFAGCYAPAIRDCTVRCDAPHDCASGQVCGDDGLCAAPEIAGQCAARALDAGGLVDARRDASATAQLHVLITGKGRVVVDGIGTCNSGDPQRGDCLYDIRLEVLQTVHAEQIQLDQAFLGWGSETCSDAPAICTFTMSEPTTVAARFGKPPAP
jgi:hypothetical protein